ncbi:hypothetical protein LWI28_011786 [Acer negundo]|uniref:Leucine-rich repeat-containing N-terminal plant-type domain-containing protein n=1 Tax=Acer negundo TaxID=4023 RepID=A0AAD5NFG3_ACENE|nr:hypothetical protein LWI28_011786 [Acer negundo]
MRLLLFSWLFLIPFLANLFCSHVVLVASQCQSDQQSLLLQLKSSLNFTVNQSVQLVKWSQDTDCCNWSGVVCDGGGHVTGLNLSYESISGGIENSTGLFGLRYLRSLNLAFNGFSPIEIPSRLTSLTDLTYLNLSKAGFVGQIPIAISRMTRELYLDGGNEWCQALSSSLTTLQVLSLSTCFLSDFSNLKSLRFSSCGLNRKFPEKIFQQLQLGNNQFDGQVLELRNASSSVLDTLDLSDKRLEGPIPKSIFQLKKLKILLLSSNKFNGTVQLDSIQRLANLTTLDLSYNSLAVNASSSSSFLPRFTTLKLASCNLSKIPNLKNQSRLFHLDLSDNQIPGEVPNWIWEIVNGPNGFLTHLNLSRNSLVGLQEPYSISNLIVLDLHANLLQGKIPPPPPSAVYVDYSNNNLSSSIPADIGDVLNTAVFFSL